VYTLSRLKADEQAIAKPPGYTKDSIVAIRKRMGVSQPIFADVLNVSTPTVRGWEQGVREPEGPSLRLLELAERQPSVLLEMAGISGVMATKAKEEGAGRAATAKRRSAVARHK
jgi:putative transcriptional regulator